MNAAGHWLLQHPLKFGGTALATAGLGIAVLCAEPKFDCRDYWDDAKQVYVGLPDNTVCVAY